MQNGDYFRELKDRLHAMASQLLSEWLPGGRVVGTEFVCGDISGNSGDSLKYSLVKFTGSDYATGETYGDLIDLYAKKHGLTNGEAAKELAERIGLSFGSQKQIKRPTPCPDASRPLLGVPPEGVSPPTMIHTKLGHPSATWCYRTAEGRPHFYVARYDAKVGDAKEFLPYSWSLESKDWVMKAPEKPRPLYNLHKLAARLAKGGKPFQVLITEGEKAADAAQELFDNTLVAMTWPNGSQAVSSADWSVLKGLKVAIWPDADAAGMAAADKIVKILDPIAAEIKVIDPKGAPDKFDAADALSERWTYETSVKWCKDRMRVVKAGKKKSQEKEPYLREVLAGPDSFPEKEAGQLWAEVGLKTSKKGVPVYNIDNMMRVLSHPEFKDLCWKDSFHYKIFTRWPDGGKVREWNDDSDIQLMLHLQRRWRLDRVNLNLVIQAAQLKRSYDIRSEPREWLDGLRWDGRVRLDKFLTHYYQAADNPYTRAVSKNWLISMVARIYEPGCQADHMVILEGAQGILKSTSLRELAGKFYAESNERSDNKDFYQSLNGAMLVEISELDSFSKAEVTSIKKVISQRVDRYRPSYGRHAQDFPRQCGMTGTTNQGIYLKDSTGGRRFWPVEVFSINLKAIKEDREQLWGEAVARYKQGESWWEVPLSYAQDEQEKRRQRDPWEDAITDWLDMRESVMPVEVLTECLKLDIARADWHNSRRICNILRRFGWDNKQHRDQETGKVCRRWRKTGGNVIDPGPKYWEPKLPE